MKNQHKNRYGDYCETFAGIDFYPLDPIPEEIVLEDIAHALSQICRFTGHTKHFYTVAQHSLNVEHLMKKDGCSPRERLQGLLHDASEAYICDIARPVKPFLVNYKDIEKGIQTMIFNKYKVVPTEDELALIKYWDNICLFEEGISLMPNKTNWAKKTPYTIDTSLKDIAKVKEKFLSLTKQLSLAI